jgi:hypothetical protein
MINIASQLPAVWTPPAAPATSPVAAVAAIRPLQESGRNGQPGAGTDPEAQSARQGRPRTEGESAPILPRNRSGGEAMGALRGSSAPSEHLVRADAEQRAQQEVADRAAEEARREQLKTVLTNVWKASAAVVERVLDRDATAPAGTVRSEATGSVAARAPMSSQTVEQLTLPWPVLAQEPEVSVAMNHGREPVAYDERGHSSLAPLEPGALISRRV